MPYGLFFWKLDFYTSPSYLILSILQGLKWFYYSIGASAWSYPQGPGQRSLCDDEALLPKVSLTPECGTIPGSEAGSWAGLRCCVALLLPFKGRWAPTDKAIFALAASCIWPRACWRRRVFGRGVKKLPEESRRVGCSNPPGDKRKNWFQCLFQS